MFSLPFFSTIIFSPQSSFQCMAAVLVFLGPEPKFCVPHGGVSCMPNSRVRTKPLAETSFSLKFVTPLARKPRLPRDQRQPRRSFGNLSFCSRGVTFLFEIGVFARGLMCTLAFGLHETSFAGTQICIYIYIYMYIYIFIYI